MFKEPWSRTLSGVAFAAMAITSAFAVAPLSGGVVASAAGIPASFLVIGSVMLAVGVALLALVHEPGGEPVEAKTPAGGSGA